jgi:hypothetical protein
MLVRRGGRRGAIGAVPAVRVQSCRGPASIRSCQYVGSGGLHLLCVVPVVASFRPLKMAPKAHCTGPEEHLSDTTADAQVQLLEFELDILRSQAGGSQVAGEGGPAVLGVGAKPTGGEREELPDDVMRL